MPNNALVTLMSTAYPDLCKVSRVSETGAVGKGSRYVGRLTEDHKSVREHGVRISFDSLVPALPTFVFQGRHGRAVLWQDQELELDEMFVVDLAVPRDSNRLNYLKLEFPSRTGSYHKLDGDQVLAWSSRVEAPDYNKIQKVIELLSHCEPSSRYSPRATQ